MPLPGSIVSDAARTASMHRIESVFERAAARADAAGPAVLRRHAAAEVDLVPQPRSLVEEVVADFDDLVVRYDDGNCAHRGGMLAHMLNERAGVGYSPAHRQSAAAVAVSEARHWGPDYTGDGRPLVLPRIEGDYTGGFHAATAVRLLDEPGIWVIDRTTDTPMFRRLDEWSEAPTGRVRGAWATLALEGGDPEAYLGRVAMEGSADQLQQSWRRASRFGVLVDGSDMGRSIAKPFGGMPNRPYTEFRGGPWRVDMSSSERSKPLIEDIDPAVQTFIA